MREIVVTFDPERKLFLYFGIVAIAVGVGPFGTYEAMTFWQRVMFWSLDVLGGLAILLPIFYVFYWSRLVRWLPSVPRFLIGVLLGAIPGAGFIKLLYGSIGADLNLATPYPVLLAEVWVFTTCILITEFVFWPLIFARHIRVKTTTIQKDGIGSGTLQSPEAPSRPRLISRLPPDMQTGQIISISMQDHYAQVTTTLGEHMLLIRLSDAIDLLDGLPGLQIHRSHWAATAHATDLTREGRGLTLSLSDGRTLPVSATRKSEAQAMLAARAQ